MYHLPSQKVGLILSGGGARAAYQVGVLKAISELVVAPCSNPFSVICGTSAGGLNAAVLATQADCLAEAVNHLENVWSHFRTSQVYRTDWPGVLRCAAKFLWTMVFGRLYNDRPVSLLDNQPLAALLEKELQLSRLDHIIKAGFLDALCITASGYSSGESVSFFQGHSRFESWHRARRVGTRTRIGIHHLMASAAIPLLFPAIRIHREYFGDGALRQLAPISPALHLGAEKVLIIGVSSEGDKGPREKVDSYPSIAQVATNILNSSFVDSLEVDMERLLRINRTISLIPEEIRKQHTKLRHIDVLAISPANQTLDQLAMQHAQDLPRSIRSFVHGSGATKRSGAGVLSYLLFEGTYCQELIRLGYDDAMQQKTAITTFLQIPERHHSNVVKLRSA